jgi:hypothetical protein
LVYADARDQAVRDAFKPVLNGLVAKYDPNKPTVILLPGGMGSQLDRSNFAYTGDPISFADFSVVWIGLGVVLSQDALKLEIDSQPPGRCQLHYSARRPATVSVCRGLSRDNAVFR